MTGTDLCVNKSQFFPVIFEPPCSYVERGVSGDAVGSGTALQARSSLFRFSMGLFGFFIDLNLPTALWLCGRLNR
jgi:hypothetical protein